MRMMNVNCPVCQQTHPDQHLQLLDWKTATYKCPVMGQVVNLTNFMPSATTMVLAPGTKEDTYNDTTTQVVIPDTVPFDESKAGNVTPAFYSSIKNVIDDAKEEMYLAPGGEFTATLAGAPTGDFTETFNFKLVGTPYTMYSASGSGNMPRALNHKIYFGVDRYIELDITDTGIRLSYFVPTTVAGSPQLQGQALYNTSLLADLLYLAKLDVVANVITLNIWESGAQKPPMNVVLNTTSITGNALSKSVFLYPGFTTGGSINVVNYSSGLFPLESFKPYMTKVFYPSILMHNTTVDPSQIVPTTPLSSTPV